MSYMHIRNLGPKDNDILMFKQVYSTEKIHGTSAHVGIKRVNGQESIYFFSGGANHPEFIKLFDTDNLLRKFQEFFPVDAGDAEIVIYGEAYGGKMQRMKETYGPNLKFIVFEVKIGDTWLNVEKAAKVAADYGMEYVPYEIIETTQEALDKALYADSEQAVRNGMGAGHKREGIVLRPMQELRKNNGERIIAKYKHPDFSETKTVRKIDEGMAVKIATADALADEWVTPNRVSNILSHWKEEHICIESTRSFIDAMIEDVIREAGEEFEPTRENKSAVGKKAALLFRARINKIG